MSPFQVPEGPYTIEKIMESIREQVIDPPEGSPTGAVQASGESGKDKPRAMIHDGGQSSRLLAQIELMNQRQGLDPGYHIHSHRRLIGRCFDSIKKVIHWGARPYTDAIRLKQEAFNEATLQALREVSILIETQQRELKKTEERLLETLGQARAELEAGLAQAGEEDQRLAQEARRIDKAVNQLKARHDLGDFFAGLPGERRLAALEKNRGTFYDISERQKIYFKLLSGMPGQVLDVGCGRGELLNLLRVHGYECWGAEIDPLMTQEARKLGVHVLEMDALAALKFAQPASLGGVFAAQVVEHFFPGDLLAFLKLARERIAPGGRIILETVNPASLGVLAKSYYRDLDHKQPIHPEYMKLLLELAGFEQVELHYLAPFSEEERLPDLPPAEALGMSETGREALQGQIERLNKILYGMQDYYVMGVQGEPARVGTEGESEKAVTA